MRTGILIIIIFATIVVAYPFATSAEEEWYPIGDPDNEPHVQELGGWAVAEHVKQAHDGLKFINVVSGAEANAAGVKYRLDIKALKNNGQPGAYRAILLEEVRDNERTLISFEPTN
ncbi:hypothetical protein CFC21_043096 [Triticum aestivum]|uniref:Cystatin domain-containing protein n=3 Tax=Triticum TaxID=4564 RepID=A0A9R1QTF8_TRITD|nr:hypothetical protein CFC21_043096 [Triticum aestivum]CDJ26341.1 unnamed protein product [Triticum aestivum]CDJ26342.1 unnamed protein product [Triticum aestivum]VAH82401.1 unnamed protein product [Triticum turgidum subsp. durum]